MHADDMRCSPFLLQDSAKPRFLRADIHGNLCRQASLYNWKTTLFSHSFLSLSSSLPMNKTCINLRDRFHCCPSSVSFGEQFAHHAYSLLGTASEKWTPPRLDTFTVIFVWHTDTFHFVLVFGIRLTFVTGCVLPPSMIAQYRIDSHHSQRTCSIWAQLRNLPLLARWNPSSVTAFRYAIRSLHCTSPVSRLYRVSLRR